MHHLLGLLPYSSGKESFPIRCQKKHNVFIKDTTVLADNAKTFLANSLLAPVFKGRVQFAILHANVLSTLGYLERQFRTFIQRLNMYLTI
jgi:hypothetical protein